MSEQPKVKNHLDDALDRLTEAVKQPNDYDLPGMVADVVKELADVREAIKKREQEAWRACEEVETASKAARDRWLCMHSIALDVGAK